MATRVKSVKSVRSTIVAFVFGVGLVAGLAGPARSGPSGFRCPTSGRLVSIGQSLPDVRNLCREPDDAQHSVELRTVRETVRRWVHGAAVDVTVERTVEVPVDEWTYDFGRNRFLQFLRFENGRLVLIDEGGKGAANPE